jgi:WD40 repeat protein
VQDESTVGLAGLSVILLCVLVLCACGVSRPPDTTPQPTSTVHLSINIPETDTPAAATDVSDGIPEPIPSATPVRISTDNAASLSTLRTIAGHDAGVTDVAFSADGSFVVSASQDGSLRVWRAADGSMIWDLVGHTKTVHSVDISPDGSLIVSGSDDRTARLWQMSDGTLIRSISNELLGRVLRVAFSPDGTLIAVGGHRCIVELRSSLFGILRRTLAQPHCSVTGEGQVDYWGLSFNADGSQIITGEGRPCCGGSLQQWQVEEIISPELMRGYDLVVRDAALSPDGETLAVALVGSTFFWLLDVDGEVPQRTLEGHRLRINDLEFSPGGEIIASASRDGRIGLWDVASGMLLGYLEGDNEVVTSIDFTSDGVFMVNGSQDGSVVLWGLP